MPREKGSGSVSQRPDGLWAARIELPRDRGEPRKRVTLYGRTEDEALAKLAEARKQFPPRPLKLDSRTLYMRAAREQGTHTRREWLAKVADLVVDRYFVPCHYCETVVHRTLIEKDHYIPVSRGGSDGLDNVVPACRPCNRDKATLTGDEYLAFIGRRSWEGIA